MAYTSDLCTGGSPYSSGDYSGEYAASKAFDNSWPASAWASAQLGDQVGGEAFIGYAFTSVKHIRRITVRPHTDQNFLPHFNVQYADAQGGPYTTVANIYVVAGDSEGEPQRTFDLPASGPHRYWRLMPSEDTILDYPARVEEIEMMGIVGEVTEAPPTTIVPPTTEVPVAYTADLCTGGTVISSGYQGAYVPANVVDNNSSTLWISLQQNGAVAGAAWIGYQFVLALSIRRCTMRLYDALDSRYYVSSAKVQCADSSGGPWTDVSTISIANVGGTVQTFDLPSAGYHTCWRFLAQANTTLDGWFISEIEMMGIVGELTAPPTTIASTTSAPTTIAPTTNAPTTIVPTTATPVTDAPTTIAPTDAPTTEAPTTVAVPTAAPTSSAPTTEAPTTIAPTTTGPTTPPPPSGHARVTQCAVTVLSQDTSVYGRVSQAAVQVLSQDNSVWARLSQVVLQVLRPYVPSTTPPPTEPPTEGPTSIAPTTSAPTTHAVTQEPTPVPTTSVPTEAPTTTAPPIYITIPVTAPPFTPAIDLTTPAPGDLITTEQGGPIEPTTECPVAVITPYQVTGAAIEVPVMTYTEVRCSQFAVELFVGRLASLPATPDFEFPVLPIPEPIEFPLDSIGFIKDDV